MVSNLRDKPNIPGLIRATLQARYERKERIAAAAAAIPKSYQNAEISERRTRKGSWTVYRETAYRKPAFVPRGNESTFDRFCAVYYREGRPRTVVCGRTADEAIIEKTLRACAEKMMEQRPLFSIPARSLTTENGLTYGIRLGMILAVLLALFVFVDFVLVPNYPELVLQAANITMGEPVYDYSPDAKIFGYRSITGSLIERFLPDRYRYLSTSMYTLVAVFVIPILAFGIFYEIAGKGADRRRMKRLPPEALSFTYGFDAVTRTIEEGNAAQSERRKETLYSVCVTNGLLMERQEFETVYNSVIPDTN